MNFERQSKVDEYRALYKPEKKTQKELVLDYLIRYGSITPLESIIAFGCYRLGARVWDLRKEGWSIRTEHEDGGNYAVYRLEE